VPIIDHVPVKLSVAKKNHYTWKTYFYVLFREYNLRDHVDGSNDLLDHRDPDWLAIDATIIRWLFLTISPDIFKTVVREGDDARTVWTKINGLFTDNKLQQIVFLQQEFFGTPSTTRPSTPTACASRRSPTSSRTSASKLATRSSSPPSPPASTRTSGTLPPTSPSWPSLPSSAPSPIFASRSVV
jgi:hypothetical protein